MYQLGVYIQVTSYNIHIMLSLSLSAMGGIDPM